MNLQDRVIVREKVTDIEDYVQAADLGIFASEAESFCLSILEAMWFGCPSVATRVGGIPEVIEEGVSGVLVQSGDMNALRNAVEGLIDDTSRRRALGSNARKRAESAFSADVIVPKYEALYRRVMK